MEDAVSAQPLSVAERFRSLKPSATVEMSERVRGARAAGREIIGMSSGERCTWLTSSKNQLRA